MCSVVSYAEPKMNLSTQIAKCIGSAHLRLIVWTSSKTNLRMILGQKSEKFKNNDAQWQIRYSCKKRVYHLFQGYFCMFLPWGLCTESYLLHISARISSVLGEYSLEGHFYYWEKWRPLRPQIGVPSDLKLAPSGLKKYVKISLSRFSAPKKSFSGGHVPSWPSRPGHHCWGSTKD